MFGGSDRIGLGAALAAAFALFWRWHSPRAARLAPDEIDRYLAAVAELPLPAGRAGPFVDSLRAWAADDDGRPVHLLEVMRYFSETADWLGSPAFEGTPEEANAHYEKHVAPLLLKRGAYPLVAGDAQGPNLMQTAPGQDPWSTAQIIRFPSRRAFLDLLADPEYARYEGYKFIALEADLVPLSPRLAIPDARWIVGTALAGVFLAFGRPRASRS